MKIVAQINGIPPCPIWSKLAKQHNFETIWYECSPHACGEDIVPLKPDLVVIQCAVRWFDLRQLNWDQLNCPIVASCGDALPLTNQEAVFKNVSLLTRLYVEGFDYVEAYEKWCAVHRIIPQTEKLVYQQLCADNHFELLPEEPKVWDWCFIGQTYPIYEERLKHYRRQLIPQLLDLCTNAYISGPGWNEIVGDRSRGDWIDQSLLNNIYNKCRVVVSIDAHDGAGYTSTRTIEAMFGGHCALIYDHPGMWYLKNFIIDGVHAFYFKNLEEFKSRLDLVKANPGIALKVGMTGRAKVIELGWTVNSWMVDCLKLLK